MEIMPFFLSCKGRVKVNYRARESPLGEGFSIYT
jgi:hypothetical protein